MILKHYLMEENSAARRWRAMTSSRIVRFLDSSVAAVGVVLVAVSLIIFSVVFSSRYEPTSSATNSRHLVESIIAKSIPSTTTEVNILDWFTNAYEEVPEALDLIWEPGSIIPSYLQGSLVRNGPAIWDAGDDYYGHLFDGVAKLTKFDIQPPSTISTTTNQVKFSTRFVESDVLDSIIDKNRLKPAIAVGPILQKSDNEPSIGGPVRISKYLLNTLIYDNCVVNVWDYNPKQSRSEDDAGKKGPTNIWAVTDTVSTARVKLESLETAERGTSPRTAQGGRGFEFLLTAHPEYCKRGSGATYNINAEVTALGIRLNLVKETEALQKREVVASLRNFDEDCWLPFVGGMPYVHSFNLTPTRAIMVINPIRLPVFDIPGLLQKGFLRASTEIDRTLLWVVDLDSGDHHVIEITEPIFYYHTVSATDDEDGVHSSIRLVGKSDSSYIIGENHFVRMDKVTTAEGRNQIAKQGTLVEIVTDGVSTASVQWYQYDSVVGFDYPTHRYSRTFDGLGPWRTHKHPRFVYGAAAFCDDGQTFDQWCLVKVDTEDTTVTADDTSSHRLIAKTKLHREASQFYSEPIFVPDPTGLAEDDGVILSHVYDGVRRESYLLILEASTMTPLAKAYTGTRNPVDFHGAFFQ